MKRLWYLATPYTDYYAGREVAFREACQEAAMLIRAGVGVFCPIAHCHPVAQFGGLDPTDYTVWLPADAPLMDASFGLIVCMMEGWEDSRGVKHEMDAFRASRKPVILMIPGLVPLHEIRRAEGS